MLPHLGMSLSHCFVTSGMQECSVADIHAMRLKEVSEGCVVDGLSAVQMLSHKIFVEFPVSNLAVKITSDVE